MQIKTSRLTIKTFSPDMAQKLNIKEVYGICLAENIASVCVLEKCGFVQVFQSSGNYLGKEAEIIKFLWNSRNSDDL